MFSRILRQDSLAKLSLLTAASLLFWNRKINKSDDIFQVLNKQTMNSIVKFYLNGKVIGQGAVLKNGFVVTSPDIFDGQQAQILAQINGQTQNYQLLKIEEGLAILQIQHQNKTQFNLAQYEIGQDAYVLGTDDQGLKEFMQCPITDSNYSIDIKLVGEESLNQTFPFILMNGCHSAPGSPVLNRKGELLGVINGKFKNKTQVIPSEYFKGLENGNQIIKPYLGLTLKTSDEGGAFIIKINSDSPAEKAGLRLGEVIKSIDGVPIQHGKDVTKMLGLTKNSAFHQFEISRDGRLRTVNVYLN